jgi:hypothetical protein
MISDATRRRACPSKRHIRHCLSVELQGEENTTEGVCSAASSFEVFQQQKEAGRCSIEGETTERDRQANTTAELIGATNTIGDLTPAFYGDLGDYQKESMQWDKRFKNAGEIMECRQGV